MFRVVALAALVAVAACAGDASPGRTAPTTEHYRSDMALDVYEPSDSGASAAVLVMVHGCCGDRRDMAGLARTLSDRGAVVVNVSVHAVADGGGWPESYVDVVCAYSWARTWATARFDRAPVTMLAWGDGALTASAVALGWNRIGPMAADCEVTPPVTGPSALIALGGSFGWSGEPGDLQVTAATIDWFGAAPSEAPTAWSWGNPTWWLDHPSVNDDVEITLIATPQDKATTNFARALSERSSPATVAIVDDAQHTELVQPRSEAGAEVVDTIARTLGLPSSE